MNRLMLDHFRRWAWVLALTSLAEFGLGWLIALGPEYTFEFYAFMLSMWTGATLLSFDLRRGVLRPVAVLPLTGRQIGRTWWVATVPIPAIALAGLLFAGAGACCHFRTGHTFPIGRLVMGSLFTLAWLGIQFTLVFNVTGGLGRNMREFFCNSVVSWLTLLSYFGSMVLCNNASASHSKSALLLGVGVWLTVVGWLRADRFDAERAGLFLGRIDAPRIQPDGLRLTPLQPGAAPVQSNVPAGRGGMRFLLETSSVRGFVQIAVMVALMGALFAWQSQGLSRPLDVQLIVAMGSFMPCWFVVFYQFLPMLRHLRFLRTLPISTAGLTALLLALAILPLFALGAVAATVGYLAWGTSAALALVNAYTFSLGGVALCVFFAVWRGSGVAGYAFILSSLFGFLLAHLSLQTRFHYLERPLTMSGAVASGCLLLAFVLTRQVLLRSGRSYRTREDPFGSFPLGANR
jgi:hypothetical protein